MMDHTKIDQGQSTRGDQPHRVKDFVRFQDFGLERRVRVEDSSDPILEAYARSVAAEGRVRHGKSSGTDEVAALALPVLREKVRSLLVRGSFAVSHGGIGMAFFSDAGRIRIIGFQNQTGGSSS